MKIRQIILYTTFLVSTNIFADFNNNFNNNNALNNLKLNLPKNNSNNINIPQQNNISKPLTAPSNPNTNLKGLAFQFKLVGAKPSYGVDVANKKVYLVFPECRRDMNFKDFKLNADGTGQIELLRTFGEHIFSDLVNIDKANPYMDISSTARKIRTNRVKIELNFNCGANATCLGANLPECPEQ